VKHLWINADDFGLTPAVTQGICEAMIEGVVAGSTAMVCRDDAAGSVTQFAPQVPGRIGLHLQLTDGTPCSDPAHVPSLLGRKGRFPRKRRLIERIEPAEVRIEWDAQLAALRSMGVQPSHLDSHHHVHSVPGVFEVYVAFARDNGLPARGGSVRQFRRLREAGVPTTDTFTPGFWKESVGIEGLLNAALDAARRVPEDGYIEMMSHPGRIDEALRDRSEYIEERERELAVLCSSELRERLWDLGIDLSTRPVFTSAARSVEAQSEREDP
jgi:predicted glycoside hydrolase/deacetylase ChbG (UPF0249 family)